MNDHDLIKRLPYWRYYDEDYDWDDSEERYTPDLEVSLAAFVDAGKTQEEARRLVESGFFIEVLSGHVIDRFYGGLLRSTDAQTRFDIKEFCELDWSSQSTAVVVRAKSWDDVKKAANDFAGNGNRVAYRGQLANYFVKREVHNPFFVIDGLGEISLMPSLWRRMLNKRSDSYMNFQNFSLMEWSRILAKTFDMEDIRRRQRDLAGDAVALWTLSDFEECADPILQDWAKCMLDLSMGFGINLSDLLSTLIQHYGLDSPVLDLTSSLDVALFFATHQFQTNGSRCHYEWVGTNNRKAVIYVLRQNSNEMQPYQSEERVVRQLNPLRPTRQRCIVSRSSPYALNLPAHFIAGVILMDFDGTRLENIPSTEYLFPSEVDDVCLRALRTNPFVGNRLTDFHGINS